MTPESKAKKLEYKFFNEFKCWYEVLHNVADVPDKVYLARAKQCALIAVDEIITSKPSFDFWDSATGSERRPNEEYWQQVKQAIEKM